MQKEITISVSPKAATEDQSIRFSAARFLKIDVKNINDLVVKKRSIDARSRKINIHLTVTVFTKGEEAIKPNYQREYKDVSSATPIIIIGFGPAGLFAALRLIELGLKPIVLERGKDVIERRKDLAKIHKHEVNPDSNYCFGEGGAGTYSDGKLYTRSKKRGSVQRILEILVGHGAVEDIMIDTHPHIGTNKLPKIIAKMRENILAAGGEIHFDCRVDDFIIKGDKMEGVIDQDGNKILGHSVILATGHSARDIFYLLDKHKILIEAKSFAMGVRIEHPQPIIDAAQYRCEVRSRYLPAASYKFVHQVNGKGVFSFCMCPGGHIVPSATAPGEVVVNGMSASTRSSRYANSGMVVAIEPGDLQAYSKHGELSGLVFQQEMERMAWAAGGKTQAAPAQRMVDFANGKFSNTLNDCSYIPGINSAPLHELLPPIIGDRLQKGFKAFGRKMDGYYTNEANILGVESRTSSPIRIPRNEELLYHPQITNLYPCGEGAGYAGGIVSAAIDGERCAEAISNAI
ncbi:MAG: FAD-binding protein [Flavobacteriales bacterium]|jgi:uncharacterized FAD-dependent dehydrogenase|tara:strand:+ start:260 stop:1810 length:1551 start_codon:yes stop_codon:yes gene_type:complete